MIRDGIKIIKEFVDHEKRDKRFKTIVFIVRTTLYDDSIQYFLDLLEILKKDFPDLDTNDIKSLVYGGMFYKRTRGLEITIDKPVKIPEEYEERSQVEYAL